MQKALPIIQIVVSSFLIALILLQKGNASGRIFAGGDRINRTLRGAEKKIFWITAGLAFFFASLNILNLLVK